MSAVAHVVGGVAFGLIFGLLKCFVNFFGCHGSSPLGYAPEGAGFKSIGVVLGRSGESQREIFGCNCVWLTQLSPCLPDIQWARCRYILQLHRCWIHLRRNLFQFRYMSLLL